MKSTVPVGTGERLRAELGRARACERRRLRLESRVPARGPRDRRLHGARPDRDRRLRRAPTATSSRPLYHDVDAPVVRTDPASAEMIKYASNAFLATKISFINEIANVCEEVGADVGVVAHAMGLDERIGGHFLRPGHRLRRQLPARRRVRHRASRGRGRGGRARGPVRAADAGHPDARGAGVAAGRRTCPSSCRCRWSPAAPYDGELVEVEVESGARVRTTADHPFMALVGGTTGDRARPGSSRWACRCRWSSRRRCRRVDPLMRRAAAAHSRRARLEHARAPGRRITPAAPRRSTSTSAVYSLEVPERPHLRHRRRASSCTTASPRTCRRSSSWPATPGTTSSC